MDLILCHTTADFDTLGAAVGLTRLLPGAKIVLTGGCHPAVGDFLALHRDEYPLIERRAVNPQQIRSLVIVDAQQRSRLGKAAEWLDLPHVEAIAIYDHHLNTESDIPAATRHLEAVGATTTLIVERLQTQHIALTPVEATVMALGIHVDTGSLTFEHSTVRDAYALAWLMTQAASVPVIAEYVEPGLSPELQELLRQALDHIQSETIQGTTLSWVLLQTESYVSGLSSLTSQLLDLTANDVLLLAVRYPIRPDADEERVTIIGRSWVEGVNLADIFKPLGGGGHSRAATVTLRGVNPEETLAQILGQLKQQVPHPLTARELMSSPVRTIRPETTIAEAQRILLRYGHSGLSVVNERDQLVGIISRRDLDIALHHGFGHAPVKGYMTVEPKTITPETPLPTIESLMMTYDIGRLPVLSQGQLVGMVTRTDVLRQLHRSRVQEQGRRDERSGDQLPPTGPTCALTDLRDRLIPPLWQILDTAAREAQARGWHLYLVGGAVRDLLLAASEDKLLLRDVDLVVDGFYHSLTDAAGVELAQALRARYTKSRLEVHGRFQTAALLWHKDPVLDSLWIDIATARTEFYPYPAANPEVEASSIHQDLYRRDFTINALALRLTEPRAGELLDFFGGCLDLQARCLRVLHANSFIEDPTRIFRAVRFAVRLGFTLEAQTEQYIRYAIESGIYDRTQAENHRAPALQTRLKAELKLILQAPDWQPALALLADLGALQCIHPQLQLTPGLWRQLHLITRGLRQLDPEGNYNHWQMRLEVLLAALPTQERAKVAVNLQLPEDSISRLQNLDQTHRTLQQCLLGCDRPSAIVHHLQQYDIPTLALIAVQGPRRLRRQILQYLTVWVRIKPPLNGNDLKALGYKPGRQYREILAALRSATLDGVIPADAASPAQRRAQARAFLAEHYPLRSPTGTPDQKPKPGPLE